MKTKLLALLAILAAFVINASEPAPAASAKKESKSWWTDFSVSPYGAVNHPNFGKPQYGAGLDVGYSINKTVSLHGTALAYESDRWGGSTIDEASVLFRADLIRASKERFVTYVLAGGDRDFERDDWAFGAGIGAELRLARNFSLGADSRIRAFFNHDKDLITRGFLSFRF